MTVQLHSHLEVENDPPLIGEPIWVRLTVTNQTAALVSVVNPNVGTPAEGSNWSFSNETYQISVLLSLNLMAISLARASGETLPMQSLNPWVTPILMPRLNLNPGDYFSLAIAVSDYFQFDRAGIYRLSVTYGDDRAFTKAETNLTFEPALPNSN